MDDPLSIPVGAVHLRPTDREANAWFGDPVPFYWEGTYHLFYVWDQGHLVLPRVCHKWGHFASRDLVHWTEYPMAVEPGEEASCGTGSVFHQDGTFHMYYLGRYFTTNGVMHETLCHATSTDLITWTKDSANPISRPDPRWYAPTDWRDGFPFWNEEAQEYWMLVTASLKEGPEPFRGAIALLASRDLRSWEARAPFWAPHLGRHLECPDLFYWNGWWYLLFSGAHDSTHGTLYRKSRSLCGPWETPRVETFDGPFFYAGKTAGDGRRRMLFGWLGTRAGDADSGYPQWGGHGLVRELVQDPTDGSLWVKCPPERLQLGTPAAVPSFTPQLGRWRTEGPELAAAAPGLAYATTDLPGNRLIRFRFRPDGGARRFGALLRTDPGLSDGYRLAIEPEAQRFTFSSYGPEGRPRLRPVDRPLPCDPRQEFTVTLILSGSIVEVFVNDRSALALRVYDHRGPSFGLFVEEGAGTFTDLSVRSLPDDPW